MQCVKKTQPQQLGKLSEQQNVYIVQIIGTKNLTFNSLYRKIGEQSMKCRKYSFYQFTKI